MAEAIDVKRCPEGTAEAQRAATRAYYKPIKLARKGILAERTDSTPEPPDENEGELMAEHFADAFAAGQSREDACDDWDYMRRLR